MNRNYSTGIQYSISVPVDVTVIKINALQGHISKRPETHHSTTRIQYRSQSLF